MLGRLSFSDLVLTRDQPVQVLGAGDVRLRDGVLERPVADDEEPVAEEQQFVEVAGHDHDPGALRRSTTNGVVDLFPSADVHSDRRLVEEQDLASRL